MKHVNLIFILILLLEKSRMYLIIKIKYLKSENIVKILSFYSKKKKKELNTRYFLSFCRIYLYNRI